MTQINVKGLNKMGKKRKLFCEYGPIAYKISLFKEAKKKDLIDLKNERKFAKKKNRENFEYIWKGDTKVLFRKLRGVDMQLQKNKVKNLQLASQKIDWNCCESRRRIFFLEFSRKCYKKKRIFRGISYQ